MNRPSPEHPFKSHSFLHSLGFAWNGIRSVFRSERNFRTHVVMAALVLAGGLFFRVSTPEWGLLILSMTLMMVVEILNTALEYLVDMLAGERYSQHAKSVKDIAAGACLICALGVAAVGLMIFAPYGLNLFLK